MLLVGLPVWYATIEQAGTGKAIRHQVLDAFYGRPISLPDSLDASLRKV